MNLITTADYHRMMQIAGIHSENISVFANTVQGEVAIVVYRQRLHAFLKRKFIKAMIEKHKPISVLVSLTIKI